MTKCLQCQSERVTKGKLVEPRNGGPAQFRPEGLRSWALTLNQGPDIQPEAYACLDCGLFWSSVSTTELTAFLKKHCEERLSA